MINIWVPRPASQSSGLRGINVPLASWDARPGQALIVVTVPLALGIDVSVDRAGDSPVSTARLVQANHRRAFAVMSHTGHQILDACAAGHHEGVSGIAEIMEMHAACADGLNRMGPARHPVEVAPPQR